MKLITKVMPNLKHFACTGFGMSSDYYGGEFNQLAGTGQGNRFSGDLCRDTSCLIIKEIERQKFGMIVVSNLSGQSVQKTAVAFVDDNDLIADGEEAERDMNNMITTYDDLHTASGGNMQEEKSKFFGWIWRWKAGFKEIENKLQETKVKGKKLHKKSAVKVKKP